MATYFHGGGSELQAASADGTTTMQTLYLMNPSSAPYVPFSDTPNMFFLNPAGGANPHALSAAAFTHAPITTAAMLPPPTSEDPGRSSNYLWGFAMEQTGGGTHHHHHHHQTPTWQLGLRPTSPRRQGLSLSLLDDDNNNNNNDNTSNSNQMGEQLMMMQVSPSSASVSNSMLVVRSKYLRAAQEVLEEVVSVGKGVLKSGEVSSHEGTKNKIIKKPVGDHDHQSFIANNGDKRTPAAAELTTPQRQDLHMKKAKLLNMLHEVEQRYKQYHQQMQMVVSAFEQAAGMGSARSYTAVALQTISRQFRCLKDAIEGQIKATSKSLGEEEECAGAKVEGSRLRFVDQQLRQHRALQHLGMMHQNAWRPQRGLPERAVSVLRAWLFEHFLHPYPKDSDKALLAKQTGLTRSQVSNWFINARVRLWKPMVEEMYLEEMKEQEKNGAEDSNKPINPNPNPTQITQKSQQNTRKPESENPGINPTKMMNSSHHEFSSNSTISTSAMTHQNFNLIGSPDPDRILQPSPKKPRGADMQGSLDSILLSPSTTAHSASYGGYAGFHGNGNVSLTLGLPHCENLSQLSGNHHHHHQQSFLTSGHHNIQLGRRLELGQSDSDFCGISSSPAAHSAAATAYENMELQNRTKEFAAQLLPDFVA